jgi:hypothetical protein
MQQRDRTVKFLLRHFVAGGRKLHGSKLLGIPKRMPMRSSTQHLQNQKQHRES